MVLNEVGRYFSLFYASTIYQIFPDQIIARIGIVIVIGIIIISMSATLYIYTQHQTNFIIAKAGEPVVIGPVQYTLSFDGTFNGNKETIPANTFVRIKIIAKNISDEKTWISKSQFFLIDEKQQKHQSIYGRFSAEDLSDYWLESNKPVILTTQFDIPYNEQNQYNIVIHPSKQQSSVDVASVCITNC